ncbi:hypothetical protein KKA93_00505 [Patescibacteria group bacterium]|nr:hypothetical protein [Patescibacteria group bacterium]MBU1663276.1 hypothetical protein [Patescibacteria group bacterium]MBU1933870.1 hypothetical protein [Patescibacteria group bacterium]MBU2007955.1 hypothetical protein [Patescibacteria group bacterium]MBU2233569.1 hypothetical protein [Patescibacteria group bacterium]
MNNFTIENLNDPIFVNKLDEKVNKIEFFNDTKQALSSSKNLEKLLFKNEKSIRDAEILKTIKIIIARLKFILFNTLSENEILDIFEKYLAVGVKMAYLDLGEILKMRISFIPIDKRNEFKEKIKKVILNNQEDITEKFIIDNQAKIIPTISAWLKLYNKELGTEQVNNLEQNKFYINNPNFNRLSDLEKLEVKELFNMYEYLKRSSMTIEGNEDDTIITDIDGRDYWFKEGRFIKLDKTVSDNVNNTKVQIVKDNKLENTNQDRNELTQLASQYSPNSLERKAIEEEIKRLNYELSN